MKHLTNPEDRFTLSSALVIEHDSDARELAALNAQFDKYLRPAHLVEFEEGSHGIPFTERALQRIVRDLFKRFEEFEPTTSQLERLIDMRGGCRCFICPPCNACVEPVTADEFLQLIDGEESA